MTYSLQIVQIFVYTAQLIAQRTAATHNYATLPYSSSFTPYDFHTKFESTETPLLITNNTKYWSASHTTWDLNYFKQHCGNSIAKITIRPPEADDIYIPFTKWNKTHTTFSKYIEFINGTWNSSSAELCGLPKYLKPADTYLFDWSLSNCKPFVLDDFVVPKWFANDILKYIFAGFWPSLFVGPSGFSHSPLHRDTFGTAFYSIQLAGTKIWRIYQSKDVELLYPLLPSFSQDDVFFQVTDTFSKEEQQKFPLILQAPYVDISVSSGELLYVPAGSPHQVLSANNGITVTVAMNYIQKANLARAIAVTSKSSFSERPKYARLYAFLVKYDWSLYWDFQIAHTSYHDFVARQFVAGNECTFGLDFTVDGNNYQVTINGLKPEAKRIANELSETFKKELSAENLVALRQVFLDGIVDQANYENSKCANSTGNADKEDHQEKDDEETKYCKCIREKDYM